MKSGLLVLKTLEFNGRDLLVVMRTLAFFFYSLGRKTVDTCLPLFFWLSIMAFFCCTLALLIC